MTVAFLFPGQGSQRPGMLHHLPDHEQARRTLDEASSFLGVDVLCLDSAPSLESPVAVQLCLLTAGVAAARAMEAEGLEAEAVAGLSVGAFAAAVHCGVLCFPDALLLVRQRAEAMSTLYPTGYGLAAIVGLDEEQVAALVSIVHAPDSPVYIGNVNAPRQMVIGGAVEAMGRALELAVQRGASKAELLRVPVPSHCPLLEPVAASLRRTLRAMPLGRPRMVFAGNVTGRALRNATDIANDLAANIAHGVRWHDATTVLAELGCDLFVEMPPGHVLTDLARQNIEGVRAVSLEQSTFEYVVKIGKIS